MKKTGLADSPLFYIPSSAVSNMDPVQDDGNRGATSDAKDVYPPVDKKPDQQRSKASSGSNDTMVSRDRDTTAPRSHEAVTPLASEMVEQIRRAVKEVGKEAATHRFSAEEKQAVGQIVFSYKQQGIRTSENEIARISINYLVRDYRQRGSQSILAQILKELNE